MIEKLDFLVRFWELKVRHATLGEPLGQGEQRELLSLIQLVTSDLKVPESGPVDRRPQGLAAQLIGAGGGVPIEIRVVSAAALVVTSVARLPVGEQNIVRVTDAVSGVEYALPCKVVWVHTGAPFTIALVVDGIPSRSSFDAVGASVAVPYERMLGWPNTRPAAIARSE